MPFQVPDELSRRAITVFIEYFQVAKKHKAVFGAAYGHIEPVYPLVEEKGVAGLIGGIDHGKECHSLKERTSTSKRIISKIVGIVETYIEGMG